MSTTTAARFLAELRRIPNVTIVEHRSRGGVLWSAWARPYTWDVNVIAVHDTVTGGMSEADAVAFCMNGRSDLAGPLYNVIVSENRVHLIGWGVTNNLGSCNGARFARARRAEMPLRAALPAPGGDDDYREGNSRTLSIALLTKVSETTLLERRTAAAVAAAAGRAFGWDAQETARSTAGHGELTRRKIDPGLGSADMGWFRATVNRLGRPVVPDPPVLRQDFVELRKHIAEFLSRKRLLTIRVALEAADRVLARHEERK